MGNKFKTQTDFRFDIENKQGQFIVKIGLAGECKHQYIDFAATAFSKELPECAIVFDNCEDAKIALKKIKNFLMVRLEKFRDTRKRSQYKKYLDLFGVDKNILPYE